MPDGVLEELLDSLLYEGYALYPYTPGATKNLTPTPFGIVYPTAYAEGCATTFDHLEMRCAVHAPASATLAGEVRFLVATGERHAGEPQRIAAPPVTIAELLAEPLALEREIPSAGGSLHVELRVEVGAIGADSWEARLRVSNRSACEPGVERGRALRRSLLSTHPVMRIYEGRFASPLEFGRASVNTFPVLATPDDRVVVGAAIVLPEHPQIAPESRGAMFDSTEIEEALLLHVQVLSEAERAEIEDQDPAVREMLARAAQAGPEDIGALHGRVTISDPAPARAAFKSAPPTPTARDAPARPAFTAEPPVEPPDLPEPASGEREHRVGAITFHCGDHVRIRPGADADIQARMLDGRSATIDRILVDYDNRTHLGVTIDDDPGRELMRESGRFLFFFPPELEVIEQ